MIRCTSGCFDVARQLSTQGFTVAIRPVCDRTRTALGMTCASCGTRYELHPAPAATAAPVVQLLVGAVA